jgi:actin-related protein 2
MIADEVIPCRALCELSFPLEEGMVKNWEDMELIWDYGFKKVKHENLINAKL